MPSTKSGGWKVIHFKPYIIGPDSLFFGRTRPLAASSYASWL